MSRFIHPYNFVPLPASVPRQPVETAPGWGRLAEDTYSGYLQADITVFTRLFIPSRRPMDVGWEITTDKHQENKHPVYKKFLYHSVGNKKMIPGSSIKGPVRSVMEVLSDSCLGLYGGKYKKDQHDKKRRLDYSNKASAEVKPGRCRLRAETGGPVTNPADGLCVCCRLFGLAAGGGAEPESGEYTALQGRLTFDDFYLSDADKKVISTSHFTLPELSDPKPWHAQFYLDTGGQIRGRKFYLHYDPDPTKLNTKDKTERNCTIQESILPGAVFTGRIRFTNLTGWELGLLLWGLELDDLPPFDAEGKRTPDLKAHKLGMGKPLGLGSVKIRVTGMALMQPARRYGEFTWPEDGKDGLETSVTGDELRTQVRELKETWAADAFQDRSQLSTLLTFPARRAISVRYPGYGWFRPCSHVNLAADGILADPCPPPATPPKPEGSPQGLQDDVQTDPVPPPRRVPKKPEKAGPKERVVTVLAVTAKGARIEFDGQTLTVTGISSYLNIKPQDKIKVRINKQPDGRLKVDFKGKAS
ncbi:RAMP superfamily CRISPR-associated protein [Desulfobacca acetoxidans]|uniref:CRISPR type III-associated protein domain-containing protein n=1 Tax=Desulfobacca acetoxidans (strain ATCC 700848 / DSM 11109 / ASRB2) TaxID=880072 RepID=F2NE31_DESAR|nr:RAMP superfamily CRISPR-associated protein [Desulfobacca acetoxidans]AEB10599.1 protein of unknown function DUF324 [Desulfobacca acetoxidans DSM 11109]